MKKKRLNEFLFGVIFLFSILFGIFFISAQTTDPVGSQDPQILTCNTPGIVQGNNYCDVDGILKPLKAERASCLNDYECQQQSCVDGLCQSKFVSIQERGDLLQKLLDFLNGIQCVPGEDDCATDGKLIRTCGSDGTWEDINNYVIGKCGFTGNDGGCTPVWTCSNWTNQADFCGTRTCVDTKDCDKTYNKPIELKTCPGTLPYCGDGVCGSGETEISCRLDCEPEPVFCNFNDVCEEELGESSFTCQNDCVPIQPKSKWWVFWLLVALILITIIIIATLIFMRMRREKKEKQEEMEKKKNLKKTLPPPGAKSIPQNKFNLGKPVASTAKSTTGTTLPYAKPSSSASKKPVSSSTGNIRGKSYNRFSPQ